MGDSYTFSCGWMVDFDGFFFQKQLNAIHIMGLSQSKGVGCGQGSGKVPAKVLEKVAENSREEGKVPKEFWGEDGSR